MFFHILAILWDSEKNTAVFCRRPNKFREAILHLMTSPIAKFNTCVNIESGASFLKYFFVMPAPKV